MTDDEIGRIEDKMSANAQILMLYFDKMKRCHNIGFHGVVYRSHINGQNYAVEVKLDKDEEAEE